MEKLQEAVCDLSGPGNDSLLHDDSLAQRHAYVENLVYGGYKGSFTHWLIATLYEPHAK